MKYVEKEMIADKIRGCLVGGAIGDALGYPVEFLNERMLFSVYGESGITEYKMIGKPKRALISDDTQMTLFTANGILYGETRGFFRGIQARPGAYVARAYQDWLMTQELSYEESRACLSENMYRNQVSSWLLNVPDLYSLRAPGNTCISALRKQKDTWFVTEDHIRNPQNNSKGCGGVMRVAPLALLYPNIRMEKIDAEGAEIAAITHGHSLGYMPAAILTHIIHRIVYPEKPVSLKEIVLEAKATVAEIFQNDAHLKSLINIIDMAIELAENQESDLANINQIGEGWVAEETIGIAIYCALRHQDDYDAGIIASVNHKGDSDSTGSVTGNILGAITGFKAIDQKWKDNLELIDVILEIADDLCQWTTGTYEDFEDKNWTRKYINMKWKNNE